MTDKLLRAALAGTAFAAVMLSASPARAQESQPPGHADAAAAPVVQIAQATALARLATNFAAIANDPATVALAPAARPVEPEPAAAFDVTVDHQ